MSCIPLILDDDSDNLVRLEGLNKKVGGVETYVNNATVQVTELKDSDGVSVPGFSAFSMSYVAASNGDYEGVLSVSVDLDAETDYTATVVATADGLTKTWRPVLLVKSDVE